MKKYTKEYCLKNKVVIEVKSESELNQLYKFFSGFIQYKIYDSCNNCYSFNNAEINFCFKEYYIAKGYEVIPFELFLINNQKLNIDYSIPGTILSPIPYNKLTPTEKNINKKIIGYKLPYDIMHWVKGDIFVLWNLVKKNYHVINKSETLPGELVEQWEPVYEKENIELSIGNPVKIVSINKNSIKCEGETITVKEIRFILNKLDDSLCKVADRWDMEINKVTIGCSEFTKEELKLVLQTYKELSNI